MQTKRNMKKSKLQRSAPSPPHKVCLNNDEIEDCQHLTPLVDYVEARIGGGETSKCYQNHRPPNTGEI